MKLATALTVAASLAFAACNASSTAEDATAVTDETLTADSRASDASGETIVYNATENGMADIKLTIAGDGTFSLWMEIYPQFESGDELEEVAYSGTYTEEGDWVELTFLGDIPQPGSLFDPQYGDANQFKVVDDRRVKINTGRERIAIWGVDCIKSVGG